MQLIFLKSDNGDHKKGDCIEVRASGTPFAGKEPDKFVMVDVPDIALADYEQYQEQWERIIEYEIVSSNLTNDEFRIRLYSPLVNSTNLGAISLSDVQSYIEGWNGTIYSNTINEVVFDIAISDVIQSERFWEINITNVAFTETNYNSSTGVHTIEIDYSVLGNNPTYIERYVTQKGTNVLSNTGSVITVELHRSDARNAFEEDIRNKARRKIAYSRYYIGSAVVDYIIAQGGTLETDLSTLMGYLQDKTNG